MMKKIVLTAVVAAALALPAYPYTFPDQFEQTYNSGYNEKEEYDNIVNDWDLGAYEDFIDEFPSGRYSAEIKSRINEIKLWEKAKSANTQESYQNYLDNTKYGRFKVLASAALKHIEANIMDSEWQNACNLNTIESYQNFITRYPDSPYTSQANARIENLRMLENWERVKHSENQAEIEEFIDRYPGFNELPYAKSRLHALKMSEYLDKNNMAMASKEFELVTMEEAVPESAATAYGIICEYNSFKKLSEYSPESQLRDFLTEYAGSKYQADVKNFLAVNLALHLTKSSTKADYNEALSYATNDHTRARVQKLIKSNQQAINNDKAIRRSYQREENGGWLGLTLEWADLSWNGHTTAGLFKYNCGVKFRIGNYADRVQAAIGVKPGFGIWDFNGIYTFDKNGIEKKKPSAFFDMPVEAEVKVNITPIGDEHQLFGDARIDYNVIRKKEVERPVAIMAGIGCAGKSWDVLLYGGLEVGSINKSYEILGFHLNPFRNSKTAGFFGLSFSTTLKLL